MTSPQAGWAAVSFSQRHDLSGLPGTTSDQPLQSAELVIASRSGDVFSRETPAAGFTVP